MRKFPYLLHAEALAIGVGCSDDSKTASATGHDRHEHVSPANDLSFDGAAATREAKHHIFDQAADHNETMPPAGNPAPSRDEREVLGDWLACDGS